jgi:hypothetical protein
LAASGLHTSFVTVRLGSLGSKAVSIIPVEQVFRQLPSLVSERRAYQRDAKFLWWRHFEGHGQNLAE